MAPRKARKKHDSFVEEMNPNSDILSNTTSRLKNIIKSWKQVYEILKKENSVYSDDLSGGEDESIAKKIIQVAKSKLHKVAAQLKLMSYIDMISWAL
jgi:hypothetical protein